MSRILRTYTKDRTKTAILQSFNFNLKENKESLIFFKKQLEGLKDHGSSPILRILAKGWTHEGRILKVSIWPLLSPGAVGTESRLTES